MFLNLVLHTLQFNTQNNKKIPFNAIVYKHTGDLKYFAILLVNYDE